MTYKRLKFFFFFGGGGGGWGFGLLGFWWTLVPAFSLIDEHSLIVTSVGTVGLGLGLGLGLVFSLIDELSLVGTRIGLVGLSSFILGNKWQEDIYWL